MPQWWSRVLSNAPEEMPHQPEEGDEQQPTHWPDHDKDDDDAHQAYQQGLMIDGVPVAHTAESGSGLMPKAQ
jgi:hypothetical protein